MDLGNRWAQAVDPGHGCDQRGIVIEIIPETVVPAISISIKRSAAEIYFSSDSGCIPDGPDLSRQLRNVAPVTVCSRFKNSKSDITGPSKAVPAPPVEQNTEGRILLFKFPVKLRYNIVDPAILQPQEDICI